MLLSELVDRVGGELDGDGSIEISGVAGIRDAREGDLTFLGHPRYEGFLATTRASAIILDDRGVDLRQRFALPAAVIRNDNPYLAFQKAMVLLAGNGYRPAPGIHPTAIVGEGARLGENVSIGPYVVIERAAEIGDGVVIEAGSYIGPGVVIGEETRIFPRVTIREGCQIGRRNTIHAGAVIGDDGFGFTKDGESHKKVPQIGCVVLEDDVEVGSNACIDRATVGETRIGTGTRIDNLVQIAHNVTIGRHTIVCAQTGIAGSSRLGDQVVLAGQVGVSGHLTVGDGAQLGAQAGVIGDVPPGQRASGYPARPHREQMRVIAATRRLPEILRRVEELEQRLAAVEGGELSRTEGT
jgi:UDP-3-O-[3-hydroxymyristoyl] glucosamine N-acyltransferase